MKLASYYYNFRYGVVPRKPRLALRYFSNYYQIFIKRQTPLRYVDLCITSACNLDCQHCFAADFRGGREKELNSDEWVNVVNQCHQIGSCAFAFTGGEPLLYSGLEDLVRQIDPSDKLIVVCTNGTQLTRSRAESLYNSGVDVVQISLESLDPNAHNAFRRNEAGFSMTMEGLENALAVGIRVAIIPTVSHENVRSPGFLDLLEWANRKGLMVNLALATPVGNWEGRTEILLTEKDIDFLDKLTVRHPNVRRDFETNYVHRGCGAATEKLYITPTGEVLSCPYMHISFGNVRDSPISEIRDRMLTVTKLNGYFPKCLVAEDREFIEGPLSRTFGKDEGISDWRLVFSEDGLGRKDAEL